MKGQRSLRPIAIYADRAVIPLTQGMAATIDVADVDVVRLWNWHPKKNGRFSFHAARSIYDNPGSSKTLLLHVALLGTKNGLIIDHINGDGLDNRRCNLRFVTQSQNRQNTNLGSRNRSGFRGVSFNKATGKWRSVIYQDRKQYYLGEFLDLIEATRAYANAAERIFGPYRRMP